MIYTMVDPTELWSKSPMCVCVCVFLYVWYDFRGDDMSSAGNEGRWVIFRAVCTTYLWLAARPCTWPGPRGFGPGRYTGRCDVAWAWECWANWSTGQAWWRPRNRRHYCRHHCQKWRRQRQWRRRPTGPRRRRPAAGRARRPWATQCSMEGRRGSRRTRPSFECLLPARRREN